MYIANSATTLPVDSGGLIELGRIGSRIKEIEHKFEREGKILIGFYRLGSGVEGCEDFHIPPAYELCGIQVTNQGRHTLIGNYSWPSTIISLSEPEENETLWERSNRTSKNPLMKVESIDHLEEAITDFHQSHSGIIRIIRETNGILRRVKVLEDDSYLGVAVSEVDYPLLEKQSGIAEQGGASYLMETSKNGQTCLLIHIRNPDAVNTEQMQSLLERFVNKQDV